MGLQIYYGPPGDFEKCCWDGSYTSFFRFRALICEAAGLGDIKEYAGYEGVGSPFTASPQILAKREKASKPWPKHPLTPLLYHAGCEGIIEWQVCGDLADALLLLLPKAEALCASDLMKQTTIVRLRDFILGARSAFISRCDLRFS